MSNSLHALVLDVELRLPGAQSLKEKRGLLKPVVERIRSRYQLSVAEVGYQDKWQRARLAVAIVAGSAGHVDEVADEVERFIWSDTRVEVVGIDHHWLET